MTDAERIEMLAEALKPFAKTAAPGMERNEEHPFENKWINYDAELGRLLTYGDLMNARRALNVCNVKWRD